MGIVSNIYSAIMMSVGTMLCPLHKSTDEIVVKLDNIHTGAYKDVTIIQTTGPYRVYEKSGKLLGAYVSGSCGNCYASSSDIVWSHHKWNNSSIYIVPIKGSILVNGVEHSGYICCEKNKDSIVIYNMIQINKLLTNVLGIYDRDSSAEFLALLAIILRTDILYHKMTHKNSQYDYTASRMGYRGVSGSLYEEDRLFKIIQKTDHFVLKKSSGINGKKELFPIMITEHSAGYLLPENSCNLNQYPLNKVMPAFNDRINRSWVARLSLKEIQNFLDVDIPISLVNTILENDTSKHVSMLTFTLDNGEEIFIPVKLFMMRFPQVKSAIFSYAYDQEEVCFAGFGEGLCRGICLYSFNQFILSGKPLKEIFHIFFPNMNVSIDRNG